MAREWHGYLPSVFAPAAGTPFDARLLDHRGLALVAEMRDPAALAAAASVAAAAAATPGSAGTAPVATLRGRQASWLPVLLPCV